MVSERIGSSATENDEGVDSSSESYRPLSDEELEKATREMAKIHIAESPGDLESDKARRQWQGNEKKGGQDNNISELVGEAEARLGRSLSPSELLDLVDKYGAWPKNQDSETEEVPTTGPEYNYRNTDLYLENTFMLAAADSLADSPDIHYIDTIAREASDKTAAGTASVFEALKQFVRESNPDERGGYAATDLMQAFIDITSAYIVSKDEKVGRGFAKGLLTGLEMRIDAFTKDRPNPNLDALRVDYSIIKPIADEFIKGYDPSYDNPNTFRDYLKNELQTREADMRSAKRRGEQIPSDIEREAQAIRTALTELEKMQSSYDKSLKTLHDTAYMNHRIIN